MGLNYLKQRKRIGQRNPALARLKRQKLRRKPKAKALSPEIAFFGKKVLANAMVSEQIWRAIRASYRHGVEASTNIDYCNKALTLDDISLKGAFGGESGSTIDSWRELKGPVIKGFNFGIHTHPKISANDRNAYIFSSGDLKAAEKQRLQLMVVMPFDARAAGEKSLRLDFIFARFPKRFDSRAYQNRLFQETRGRLGIEGLKMQRRLLREMGARFSEIPVYTGRRLKTQRFRPETLKKIAFDLS